MPRQARRTLSLLSRGLRSALYPLAALPVGLYVLALALMGRRQRAADLQVALLRALRPPPVPEPNPSRIVFCCVASLPLNVLAFAVAGYLWLILPINLGYPLRPDVTEESLKHGTWGGPTLAGAWSVHAIGAVGFFVLIALPLLSALGWLQSRIARAVLGDEAH